MALSTGGPHGQALEGQWVLKHLAERGPEGGQQHCLTCPAGRAHFSDISLWLFDLNDSHLLGE